MTDYYPDKWLVIKISDKLYKVFGTWYGGYLQGDSWRLNSGVKGVELDGDYIVFNGFSSSRYFCHKDSYGASGWTGSVLKNWIDHHTEDIIILEDTTNWIELLGRVPEWT